MKYNPDIHHRRSIRLRGYDYAGAGAYFVTICVQERECLFGEIVDEKMILTAAGRMVEEVWRMLPRRFPNVEIDEIIVMPNHLHGIIVITDSVGAPLAAPDVGVLENPGAASGAPTNQNRGRARQAAPLRQKDTLGKIMRAFKSMSAIEVNRVLGRRERPLWQRNYYERIVRDDDEWNAIRDYIRNNPAQWADDDDNPDQTRT